MMIQIIAKIVSWICLGVLLLPPLLFLAGTLTSLNQVKQWMLAATIVWFVSTPLWMWSQKNS